MLKLPGNGKLPGMACSPGNFPLPGEFLYHHHCTLYLVQMKVLFFYFLLSFFTTGIICSQTRYIRTWTDVRNGPSSSPLLVCALPDGGWTTVSFPRSEEAVWITRYRPCGDILWEKSFRDADIKFPVSLSLDNSNNFLIAFQTENSSLQKGVYLLLVDMQGTPISASYYYGGQDLDLSSAGAMEDGNYFFGGGGGDDWSFEFLTTIDGKGEVLWSKKREYSIFRQSAVPVSDGGILSCTDDRITKWTKDGNIEWTSVVSASNGPFGLLGKTIPLEINDGILLVAPYDNQYSNLLKIDKSGELEWNSPSFPIINSGGLALVFKFGISHILTDAEGNIILAGSTGINASNISTTIYKFDPTGTPIFSNTFILPETYFCYDFDFIEDGGLIILSMNQDREPTLFKTDDQYMIGCYGNPDFNPMAGPERTLQTTVDFSSEASDMFVQREEKLPTIIDKEPHEETDLCFFYDNPPGDITIDTFICLGAEIEIEAVHPYAGVLWEDGSVSNPFTVTEPGTYYADFSFCGIQQRVNFNVPDGNCPCIVEVPNVFTPNNDGVNDFFAPVYDCVFTDFQFSVYNRWGKKVFFSQSQFDGWDGKIRGESAPSDVYIWELVYAGFHEGQVFTRKSAGDVTLLR